MLDIKKFGKEFVWGVAQASYQTEGAYMEDGKGLSVWDVFSNKKGSVERNENGNIATDFYHRYAQDIELVRQMNFKAFRFSLSWARIIPQGIGNINQKGIDFYNKVIDKCLEIGIEPWITIYHWDHPQSLEDKGGWTNRQMIEWFSYYTDIVTKHFGDRVKNWMILNEPFSFTVNGYFTGDMAPGKKGINNFLASVHHSNLCQAQGARIVRQNVQNANIGTTHFVAYIEPYTFKDIKAAERIDALINRMYIEPSLGKGYPTDKFPYLKKIEKFIKQDDYQAMQFDFDFIGLQYYFRFVIQNCWYVPYIKAKEVKPAKRNVPTNEMNCEVFPNGLLKLIKKLDEYEQIRKIIITENGVCYGDILENGQINDYQRIEFFKNHLKQVQDAIEEGIKVGGYFVWSLTDNFEWDKGFRPRFGLVYIDYLNNLRRIMKASGYWFKEFLSEK